jgi:putative ABC transport system permease protein
VLLTSAAVALSVAVFIAVLNSSIKSRTAFARGSTLLGGTNATELHGHNGALDESKIRRLLPPLQGVRFIGVLERLGIAQLSAREVAVLLVGVPSDSADTEEASAALPVTIGYSFAAQNQLSLGDRFTIIADDQPLAVSVSKIQSFSEGAPQNSILAPLPRLQELLKVRGTLSYLVAIKEGGAQEEEQNGEHEATLNEYLESLGLTVVDSKERANRASALLGAFTLNLGVMCSLTLVVTTILIFGVANLNFLILRPQFTVLRTLGVPSSELMLLVIAEGVATSLLGATLGLSFGAPIIHLLEGYFLRTMSALYVQSGGPQTSYLPTVSNLVVAYGASLLITFVASFLPARRALQIVPGLSSRTESDRPWSTPSFTPLVALGALSATLLLLSLSSRTEHPFAAHGAALTLIIAIVALALLGLRWLTRGRLGLRWKTLVTVGGLRAALRPISLMTALTCTTVATIVGLNLMVGSFRTTMQSWITSTLQADLFVRARTPDDSLRGSNLSAETVRQILATEGVLTAERTMSFESSADGQPVTISGMEISQIEKTSVVLKGAIDPLCLKEERCILLTEGAARRLKSSVGNLLPVGGKQFKVSAIIQDFASERGRVLMPIEAIPRLFGVEGVRSIALTVEPNISIESVERDLVQNVRGAAIRIHRAAELRDLALEIFDETFATLDVMRGVLLFMGIVGFLLLFLQIRIERFREYQTLFLFGCSPFELTGLAILESFMILLPGLLAGTFGGLALSLILIYYVNPLSFGWSFPIAVTPLAIFWPALLMLVFSVPLAAIASGQIVNSERAFRRQDE